MPNASVYSKPMPALEPMQSSEIVAAQSHSPIPSNGGAPSNGAAPFYGQAPVVGNGQVEANGQMPQRSVPSGQQLHNNYQPIQDGRQPHTNHAQTLQPRGQQNAPQAMMHMGNSQMQFNQQRGYQAAPQGSMQQLPPEEHYAYTVNGGAGANNGRVPTGSYGDQTGFAEKQSDFATAYQNGRTLRQEQGDYMSDDMPVGTPQARLRIKPESSESRFEAPSRPVPAYEGSAQAQSPALSAPMATAPFASQAVGAATNSDSPKTVASYATAPAQPRQTSASEYAASVAAADANAVGYADELRSMTIGEVGAGEKRTVSVGNLTAPATGAPSAAIPESAGDSYYDQFAYKAPPNGNTKLLTETNDRAYQAMVYGKTYEGAQAALAAISTPYDDEPPRLLRAPVVRPGMSQEQIDEINQLNDYRRRYEQALHDLKVRFQMLLVDPDVPDFADDDEDLEEVAPPVAKSEPSSNDSAFVKYIREQVAEAEGDRAENKSRVLSPIEMLLKTIQEHTGINVDDIDVDPNDAAKMRMKETQEVAQEVRRRKEEFYRRYVQDMKRSSNLDQKFCFANLDRDKFNNDAFSLGLRFISNIYPKLTPQMFLLFGEVGTGKTALCNAVGNKYMQIRSRHKNTMASNPDSPIVMMTTFDDIKKTWFYSSNESYEDRAERNRKFNAFCTTDLLILDGLCSDNTALDPFAQKIFNELLRRRSGQGLPMMITTSINLQSIHKAIGDLCYEGIKSFSVTAACLFGRSRRPFIRFNGSFLP